MKISPAVIRALAFYRVTGGFPSHIHLNTWSAAYRMLDEVPHTVCGVEVRRRILNAEAMQLTDSDPLWLAAKYLMDRGFKLRNKHDSRRLTSHYLPFWDPSCESDRTALAYRSGGGSITTAIHAEGSGIFIRNETTHFHLTDTRVGGVSATR